MLITRWTHAQKLLPDQVPLSSDLSSYNKLVPIYANGFTYMTLLCINLFMYLAVVHCSQFKIDLIYLIVY